MPRVLIDIVRTLASLAVLAGFGCSESRPPEHPAGSPASAVVVIPSAPESAGKSRLRAPKPSVREADLEPLLPERAPRPVSMYGEWAASDIATDATHLYWTEADRSRVRAMPKIGGTPMDLSTTERAPWDIALVQDDVIFANRVVGSPEGSVASVPKRGGSVRTLASQVADIRALCADGGGVYFATSKGIERVSLDGRVRVTFVKEPHASALALDGTDLYWIASSARGRSLLRRAPKAAALAEGAAVVTLATFEKSTDHVVVDDRHVYWTVSDGVFVVPKAGGAVRRVTRSVGQPSDLALHDGVLYFPVRQLFATDAAKNALLRAPTAGGRGVVVLWGNFGVGPLAVDGDGIWWSMTGDLLGLVSTPFE